LELMLAFIVLSTVFGLTSRSAMAATRIMITILAVAATLAYALFPRLM